jgi:hypothetical protein
MVITFIVLFHCRKSFEGRKAGTVLLYLQTLAATNIIASYKKILK